MLMHHYPDRMMDLYTSHIAVVAGCLGMHWVLDAAFEDYNCFAVVCNLVAADYYGPASSAAVAVNDSSAGC
jgi:hypothetical protein